MCFEIVGVAARSLNGRRQSPRKILSADIPTRGGEHSEREQIYKHLSYGREGGSGRESESDGAVVENIKNPNWCNEVNLSQL